MSIGTQVIEAPLPSSSMAISCLAKEIVRELLGAQKWLVGGCENGAGKLRQNWFPTAGINFTKHV